MSNPETPTAAPNSALAWAHPVVREWFTAFGTPTEPQIAGWPHILAHRNTLISAPTGSGKTLAAFLACIDSLVRQSLTGDLQRAHPGPLHLPAQGPRQRRAEESRPAARRDPATGRRARLPHARHPHHGAHRRHSHRDRAAHAQAASAHPRHHPGVALHPAHRRPQPRNPAPRPHRHRR